MLLAIDIGNTSISLGIFKENTLIKKLNLNYQKNMPVEYFTEVFKTILKDKDITECAISSVVDEITSIVSKSIEKVFNIKPFIINFNTDFGGMKISSKHPEKIGMDRISNACAIKKLYASKPAIVVDIGTATTFDIINKKGNFIGGIIIPGLNTQLKSLYDNTSKLPKIDLCDIKTVTKTINTDTRKAILSGVVKGHAHAIEGLLEDCKKELKGNPVVIATGGNAKLVSKYAKENLFDEVNLNLTLEGLYYINELNK